MITHKNYRSGTCAVFQEMLYVPPGWPLIHETPGSKYWMSPCEQFLARESDHWGAGVGINNWYIAGMIMVNSYSFKNKYRGRKFLAVVAFADMKAIDHGLHRVKLVNETYKLSQ